MNDLKFSDSKDVLSPGTHDDTKNLENKDEPLEPRQETAYRALVARANYMSPDRPDISHAVKELARNMSKPTTGDWAKLKRLGRYLVGRPRLQTTYPWQHATSEMVAYTDADWAGDKVNRKSTSGGCVMMGAHVLKCWSKTQSLIALSSGESELYATLRTAAETLGMISMAKDLGINLQGKVWGDASAALGIIHRKGLGRTRHIDAGYLWIQQVAAERRLQFSKVMGRDNPADLFTKYLDQRTMDKHVEKLRGRYVDGRPSSAPELHNVCVSWAQYIEDSQEKRTDCKSVVEAELQTWVKTQIMQANKQTAIAREMNRENSQVPIRQKVWSTGGNDDDGDNKSMLCSVKEGTARQWHEESQPGESRGQFLTRKWKEILKMYPITDKDREEFVEKTKEVERTTTQKVSTIRAEK